MVIATHEMGFARDVASGVALPARGPDRRGRVRRRRCSASPRTPRPACSWTGSSPPAGCEAVCRGASYTGPVPPFRIVSEFEPAGDQPQAIDELTAAVQAGDPAVTLLGATGTGKTFTIAHVIQRVQRPTLVMAPEQVAGRPAGERVPRVLPGQRGRVLRQLLRLLPARGVRPADRHVHREGQLGERGDRAVAALGHGRAPEPPRRPDRRQRLGDLRPGLAGGVRGPAAPRLPRHRGPDGVRDAAARGHPVQAQPGQPRPRDVPGHRATRSSSSRRTRSRATASSGGATRSSGSAMFDPTTGEIVKDDIVDHTTFPATHYVAGEERMKQALVTIEEELHERLALARPTRASCWRRSGCGCGRPTTSRCCARSGSAAASRTTRGTSTDAGRAPRRSRCWTTSRTTTSSCSTSRT